jgi:GR25 family glycosyltransferase involved in LPS biosynthesis
VIAATCLYINLDAAESRRAELERSFRAAAPDGWRLQRIRAVGGDEAAVFAGSAPSGVKGCFLSHRRAVEAALQIPGDVLIVEDDSAFSRRGLEVLRKIAGVPARWDLLMCDLAPLSVGDVFRYARQREVFERTGQFMVDDLAKVPFAGSSAYLLRDAAKAKLLALTEGHPINEPFDFVLSRLIREGRLCGMAPVPFLTTLGAASGDSQINAAETPSIAALNVLRRLVFVDRDLAACEAALAALDPTTDDAARRCGRVIAALFAGD